MLKLQNRITSMIQSHFALSKNTVEQKVKIVEEGKMAARAGHFILSENQNPILLGKPNYKVLPNKRVIRVPYFMNKTEALKQGNLQSLGTALQTYLSTSIVQVPNIELRFIRLQYPYLDSFILSQYIAINAGKYNFNRMQKMLFRGVASTTKNIPCSSAEASQASPGDLRSPADLVNTNGLLSPYNITGVKMELAGRLTTQRSIPRKTVSNAHTGSFNVSHKLNSSLNTSQYASKNKIGSFTIKV